MVHNNIPIEYNVAYLYHAIFKQNFDLIKIVVESSKNFDIDSEFSEKTPLGMLGLSASLKGSARSDGNYEWENGGIEQSFELLLNHDATVRYEKYYMLK